jgi:serine/threonine-protein kinase
MDPGDKRAVALWPPAAEASVEHQRIANYQILRKLSEGGMGVVYEARHLQLDRRAAIKVLHPAYAHHPEYVQRLLNEARAANLVEHPGIVEVFEVGQLPDQSLYIIMELLKGESLSARLDRCRRLTALQTLRLGRQLASALAAAHGRGIIHRDLKPDNIMLVSDPDVGGGERIKILDFGIAKLAPEHHSPAGMRTATGITMGTPSYMSPEQCLGAASVTAQSDVYALGITLYEMLTGEPPFRAEGHGAVMLLHMTATAAPLSELVPGIPPSLAMLVHRMLAKQPALRPTMAEVEGALTQSLSIALAEEDARAGETRVFGSAEHEARAGETRVFGSAEHEARPALGPPAPSPLVSPLGSSLEAEPGDTRVYRRSSWPDNQQSTLGRAAAQLRARGRWQRGLLVGGGLGALVLVILVALSAREDKVPPRPAASDSGPAARPSSPSVRWSIQSEPAGARVLHIESGRTLGTTPLSLERAVEPGQAVLLLRLDGYEERQILLPKDRDVLLRESLRPQRGTRPGGIRPTAPGRPAPHRADDLRTIRRLDLRTRDPVRVD